jgi:methylenetetrahydrofolate dehydrogenase (NADP+)/methenyltetrahydrofolate cyclohydrolase
MLILDGKACSQARKEALKPRIQQFQARHGRPPHLVVVIVGQDPASQVYVRNKQKTCEAVGMRSTLLTLPAELSQQALNDTVRKLNEDVGIDGILVQLPLPKGLHDEPFLDFLSPYKDADGFSPRSMGLFWGGRKLIAPCTPQGVIYMLKHFGIDIAGKHAVVVGRSNIVGKPMAHLLLQENATVTVCHSATKNLREHTLRADLVVVAAGKKHMLGKDDFKKGAVVVDVGMHGTGSVGGLCGDVRFDELKDWASAATPVPGGVGPMTISTLLENTVTLAELRMAEIK